MTSASEAWLTQQNLKQSADLIVGLQGNPKHAAYSFYSADLTENISSEIFCSTKSFFK